MGRLRWECMDVSYRLCSQMPSIYLLIVVAHNDWACWARIPLLENERSELQTQHVYNVAIQSVVGNQRDRWTTHMPLLFWRNTLRVSVCCLLSFFNFKYLIFDVCRRDMSACLIWIIENINDNKEHCDLCVLCVDHVTSSLLKTGCSNYRYEYTFVTEVYILAWVTKFLVLRCDIQFDHCK